MIFKNENNNPKWGGGELRAYLTLYEYIVYVLQTLKRATN